MPVPMVVEVRASNGVRFYKAPGLAAAFIAAARAQG